ncbi:MAG: hypothetical protein SFT92_02445 [Rickettsiales bacterium]|nr:hypothetical protein [Rickettsiales bacterium]
MPEQHIPGMDWVESNVSGRAQHATNEIAGWANKNLHIDEKTTAGLVPIAAAGGMFMLISSFPKFITSTAEKLGNFIKRLVKPIPLIGEPLGHLIDGIASVSHYIVAGAAAVLAFFAFKSSKNFDKESLPSIINDIRKNDNHVQETIRNAAEPDFKLFKNLKYYSRSFELHEQQNGNPNFKIDFTNTAHLDKFAQYIQERREQFKAQRSENSSVTDWVPRWMKIFAANHDRIDRYYDAGHEVNALSAADEELRRFRRELSQHGVSSLQQAQENIQRAEAGEPSAGATRAPTPQPGQARV